MAQGGLLVVMGRFYPCKVASATRYVWHRGSKLSMVFHEAYVGLVCVCGGQGGKAIA